MEGPGDRAYVLAHWLGRVGLTLKEEWIDHGQQDPRASKRSKMFGVVQQYVCGVHNRITGIHVITRIRGVKGTCGGYVVKSECYTLNGCVGCSNHTDDGSCAGCLNKMCAG